MQNVPKVLLLEILMNSLCLHFSLCFLSPSIHYQRIFWHALCIQLLWSLILQGKQTFWFPSRRGNWLIDTMLILESSSNCKYCSNEFIFLHEFHCKCIVRKDISLTQYGFNLRFWLHCHFSFFVFSFLRTQFGNLKCSIGDEFKFLSNCRFRFGLYNTWNRFIQNIAFFKFFLHCILFSLMFVIVLEHNWL